VSDDELIDGIYKLVMCIATGGSSQVWEVIEQASGRHLAMKLLKQDSPDFKEHKIGLKHEAEVLKTLDHPMIVKFEKYSASRDNTYLVMEHFRASNVKLQLKSDMRSVHVRARKLFESVCQALSHVHAKGWIHRDVKPDNVLMNKVGEIRLVDFSLSSKEVKGFAKIMGGGKLKSIQGTRTYIAPETIRKLAPTFQTDLYSLGIMFFEVLTGRTPFQAPSPEELLKRHLRDEPPNPSEFNKNVSPDMDRLIFRLLKKKPTDRPASIDEVLAEVKRIRIFKEDITEATAADEGEDASVESLGELRLDSRADAKLSLMLQANPDLARQFEEEKKAKSAAKKAKATKIASDAKASTDREAAKAAGKPGKGGAQPPQQPPMPQPMMPQPMMPGYPPQGYQQYPPPQPYGMPPGSVPGGYPPGMMPGMPAAGMPPGAMPPGYPNPAMPPQAAYMPPGYPAQPPASQVGPPIPLPGPGLIPGAAPAAVPGLPMPPAAVNPVAPIPSATVPRPAAARPAPAPATPAPAAAAKPAAPIKPATAPGPAKPAVAAPQARPVAPAKPTKPAPPPAPASPDEMEFMTDLPDVL
jgi:serine/threonine protein kinase